MEKSDLRRLIKIEDRIKELCEEYGLKCLPVEFDIVPPEKMIEIMAYHNPTNISNWKYGRDYERLKTIFDTVDPNLPYEMVINDDPARAFLMRSNTLAVQALVIAHVYAHVNFFTENKWFQRSRRDIIEMMAEAAKRFNEYERIYGIDEVEQVVDAGHALQWHSSPFELETEMEKKKRVFEQLKKQYAPVYSEFGDLVETKDRAKMIVTDTELYNNRLWRKILNTTPIEPTEDILRFIIDNSRILEDWQKDILEILRIEGQYYWPNIKTKYMNEGWACIVGNSLVHTEKGFVEIEKAEEYCEKVVGINNKLTDIKERYITKNVPTIKIKTNTGLCLEGAEYHRLQVMEKDIIVDKHLNQLSIGDQVVMSVGADIWPEDKVKIEVDTCYSHLKFSRSKNITIPTEVNEDLAYLMGMYISEGSYVGRGLCITNTNIVLMNRLSTIIKNLFGLDVEPKERNTDVGKYDIFVYSTAIVDMFEQLGIPMVSKSGDKDIPWSILQSPKSVVSSFIAGLFDGDGCVYYNGKSMRSCIFTSKSYKLINHLSIVLLNYGIVGSYSENKKKGYASCHQLRVGGAKSLSLFYDNIPFYDEKRRMLKSSLDTVKWSFAPPAVCTIIEISKGEAVNYDWHIPEGNHYVAQGFVNHNTYWHENILARLFSEGLLTAEEHGQYNISNALVKARARMSMNPYLIGSEMWKEIEDRWNKGRFGTEYDNCTDFQEKENWDTKAMKGREKIFEVMRSYTDWFFMQDFLTPDMIDKLDLYIYKIVETVASVDYIRTEHTAEQIRELIIASFANSGIPKIEIVEGNLMGDGTMVLEHRFNGLPLDKKYTEETLKHIYRVWGCPVILKTAVADNKGNIKEIVYKEYGSDKLNSEEEDDSDQLYRPFSLRYDFDNFTLRIK